MEKDFFVYRSGNGSCFTEWRIALPNDPFLARWDGKAPTSWTKGDNWVQVRIATMQDGKLVVQK